MTCHEIIRKLGDKMAKNTIGEPINLTVEFVADADKLLREDINYYKKTADIGEEEKTFAMGDDTVGHVEGKIVGAIGFRRWEINGLSHETEGMKWEFPKKCEVTEVTNEMARRLAVLSADVKDMIKRLKQEYGIKGGNIQSATIEHDGYEYDVIDNEPG